ncbi:MAG: hypothetical protein CL920_09095 [Deltaproteobacteria bacterium]|nr:hypothetical protein [Deltaproteobacteria bacterium]
MDSKRQKPLQTNCFPKKGTKCRVYAFYGISFSSCTLAPGKKPLRYYRSPKLIRHVTYSLFLLIFFASGTVQAAPPKDGKWVPYQPCKVWVQIDNDAFIFDTDRGYTQGLEVHTTGCFGSDWAHGLTKWLFGAKKAKTLSSALGVQLLGQHIYTPEDVFESRLISDDRPFAGWLHFGLSYLVESRTWGLRLTFQYGWTGAEALAAPVQNNFHRLLRIFDGYTPDVEGWDNQIPFEQQPQLSFAWYNDLFVMGKDLSAENIRHFELTLRGYGQLGFAMVNIALGARLRVGQFLRHQQKLDAQGQPLYKHGRGVAEEVAPSARKKYIPFELYAFIDTKMTFAFHNIFVSGGMWTESHGVPIQNFVPQGEIGISMRFGAFRFRFGGVFRGREGHYQNAPLGGHRFFRIQLGYEA